MSALTDHGRATQERLARQYGITPESVLQMMQALARGGGRQAQFSIPELGGMGQWSQGGMTMVGDMFNHGLQAKVAGLCADLAQAMAEAPLFRPGQGGGAAGGGASLTFAGGAGRWWPEALGQPSAQGSQNDLSYAIFPQARRLAVRAFGRVTLYDTEDHRIGGISQQQGGDARWTFTSQHGTVPVDRLRVVSGSGTEKAQQDEAAAPAAPARAPSAPGDRPAESGARAPAAEAGTAAERDQVSRPAAAEPDHPGGLEAEARPGGAEAGRRGRERKPEIPATSGQAGGAGASARRGGAPSQYAPEDGAKPDEPGSSNASTPQGRGFSERAEAAAPEDGAKPDEAGGANASTPQRRASSERAEAAAPEDGAKPDEPGGANASTPQRRASSERAEAAAQEAAPEDQPTHPGTPAPQGGAPGGGPADGPGAGAMGAEQLLGLLERLGALRDAGILTEDEFAAKKTDLLARL